MRGVLVCLICVVAVLAVGGCSSEEHSAISKAAEAKGITSFHYTQTVARQENGESRTLHDEAYYKAPDSGWVKSDEQAPYFEMIIDGTDAWVRRSDGWWRVDPDEIKSLVFSNMSVILAGTDSAPLVDSGEGPSTAGESTRIYKGLSPRRVIDCPGVPQVVYDAAELEVTIGEETKRTYRITKGATEAAGSQAEILVDRYNEAVDIPRPTDIAGDLPTPASSSLPSCATSS